MANLQSDVNLSAKNLCSKEMSKIIVPLHVVTGCDVTFFGVGKGLCGSGSRKVQKLKCCHHIETSKLICRVTKYIYNNKVSTPQNGQTHSNNLSAFAEKLFECV